ncbi:hypothetical protein [Aestuariivirga sp.]|uniref:hypothetical protein n=1 Tax=Aestuariivirga sp. TaxID=2650926 RepID=UPI0035ADA92E
MNTTVNPQRFQAQEIALAPLARGQSAVTLAGFRIGRISHAVTGDGKTSWLWTLTGPSCSSLPEELQMCGETAALADAKIQLRHAFDSWLGWATSQSDPVHWHWTEAAPGKPSPDKEDVLPLAG